MEELDFGDNNFFEWVYRGWYKDRYYGTPVIPDELMEQLDELHELMNEVTNNYRFWYNGLAMIKLEE